MRPLHTALDRAVHAEADTRRVAVASAPPIHGGVCPQPAERAARLQARLSKPRQGLDEAVLMGASAIDERTRAGRLVRTIESEVIPRLVQSHRPAEPRQADDEPVLSAADLQTFVARVLEDRQAEVGSLVEQLRGRGFSVTRIYLELLAPAARALGALWDHDFCDFPGVTVGLGRLQRLLRELSSAFEAEAPMAEALAPPIGMRMLLTQAPREQHGFGLSMVAAFFRREGWLVEGGTGGALPLEPALRVQAEWFDAVGFSVGSQSMLPWLCAHVAAVRSFSCNPGLVVLVGGPLVKLQPQMVQALGVDACIDDASLAPALAATLVAQRAAAA